jgi:hypothetical protein
MDAKTLNQICEKVYKKFPEVQGKKPTSHAQPNDMVVLIFKGTGKAPNGTKIPRIVRVTVSNTGKIMKMSTSR